MKPTSEMQKAFFYRYKAFPTRFDYNLNFYAVANNQNINIEEIERNFNCLISKSEILRSNFFFHDSIIYRRIRENSFQKINLETCENFNEIESRVIELANVNFKLESDELLKVNILKYEEEYHITITGHHIVIDLISFQLIIKAILFGQHDYYENDLFDQYVTQEVQAITSKDSKVWEYWKSVVKAPIQPLMLNMKNISYQPNRVQLSLETPELKKIVLFSKEIKVTQFSLVIAALFYTLYKEYDRNNFIIATPVSKRVSRKFKTCLGNYVQTIALQASIGSFRTFEQYVKELNKQILLGVDYSDLPWSVIQSEILKIPKDLISVFFMWDDLSESSKVFKETQIIPKDFRLNGAPFPLTFTFFKTEDSANLVVQSEEKYFSTQKLSYLLEQWKLNLSLCHSLRISTKDELLEGLDYRKSICSDKFDNILDLILWNCTTQKTAKAVLDVNQELTYGELNNRVNCLRKSLLECGVKKGDAVGIYIERNVNVHLSILAVFSVGAHFIPLDKEFPIERRDFIINDSNIKIIVTDNLVDFTNSEIKCLDLSKIDFNQDIIHKEFNIFSKDIAYIIYTSGSTGNPKGVIVSHQSLHNCLLSIGTRIEIKNTDCMLALTTVSFDISILEILLPLCFGASSFIVDRNVLRNKLLFNQSFKICQPNIIQATPSTWKIILSLLDDHSKLNDITALSGGESLANSLKNELVTKVKTLWNMYGPTETTIWSTMGKQSLDKPVNIGIPIENTLISINSSENKFELHQNEDVEGELVIGGIGVSEGYVNLSELTSKMFFQSEINGETTQFYCTGDIGKIGRDGLLYIFNRKDRQVKIDGHRIELEEIEFLLQLNEHIASAIVKPAAQNEQTILVAYLLLNNPCQLVKISELKDYLSKKLPSYCVPANYVFINEIPLTFNNKIDYNQLPSPFIKRELLNELVLPNTEKEIILVELLKRTLNLDGIGIDDDLFDLNLSSIQVMSLISEMESLNYAILPEDIFEQRTIRKISKRLTNII